MINFSIATQIKNELEDFYSKSVVLAKMENQTSLRTLSKSQERGYHFNQAKAIALIDLYYNSKFESGFRDNLGQRKIFMNVGKFRSEVASKQIDLDVKNFKFVPDDYASPWVSFFMQKEFKEYTKESYFGELLNELVDNFPKYGTVVLKKVGKRVEVVPLQNLKNEQTAKSLQTASFVIEEHPDMTAWEIKKMKGWRTEGLDLRMDKKYMVYERYGYVPLAWVKKYNGEEVESEDYATYVDAMTIVTFDIAAKAESEKLHIFYAEEINERPYKEAHYNKQHGRWLGCGVMEDLVENQQAQNIIVNLQRRSLHWSAKRIMQAINADEIGKNLLRDVADGEILEVGVNGEIKQVDLASRSAVEFNQFVNGWEKNADQKAFTYEIATGESLPSGTPFRLGVILSAAINTYYNLKREKLGLFLKKAIVEFLIPEFIKDLRNKERVIAMFSDEPGFESLKQAAMELAKEEVIRTSLLNGEAVDARLVESVVTPFDAIDKLFFTLPRNYYDDVKYKFDLDVTGEAVDLPRKVESLTTIYQVLAGKGDPRADSVLQRIAALTGENMATFAPKVVPQPAQQQQPQGGGGDMKQLSDKGGGEQALKKALPANSQ